MPNDPFILMSFVNQQLRDKYTTLEEFCAANDVDEVQIMQRLAAVGFEYMPEINQFR